MSKPVPKLWAVVEKKQPGAYAAWQRYPNLDLQPHPIGRAVPFGLTGPKLRYAVAYDFNTGRGWYRDRDGDGEWHDRHADEPLRRNRRNT